MLHDDVATPPTRSPFGPRSIDEVRVLVVEDDPNFHPLFEHHLQPFGYHVTIAPSGAAALQLYPSVSPQLILLDLQLPDIHGLSLCRTFRKLTAAPIIVVSAICSEEQKVALLDAGADDYLVKSFGWQELRARMRVALRPPMTLPQSLVVPPVAYQLAGLTIDLERRTVLRGQERILLTRTEWALFSALFVHRGHILSYAQIIQIVWPDDPQHLISEIQTFIGRLRRKIGAGVQIENVHGVGYQLQTEVVVE